MENNVERLGDIGIGRTENVRSQVETSYAGCLFNGSTDLGGDAAVPVDPVPHPLLTHAAEAGQLHLRPCDFYCTLDRFHAKQNTTGVIRRQLELFTSTQRTLYKPRMALGKRLRQARKDAGLTQRELAQRAGVSQAVVSALETRDSEWTQFLVELSRGVGVSEQWLAHGTGRKQRSDNRDAGTRSVSTNNTPQEPVRYKTISEVRSRLSSVESQLAGIRGDLSGFSARADQLQERIDRIERRLELSD